MPIVGEKIVNECTRVEFYGIMEISPVVLQQASFIIFACIVLI